MDATAITQSMTNQTRIGPFRTKRLFVALVLLVLAIYPGVLGEITRGLMVDAYTQVAVFVSATFLIFYGAERLFKFDIGDALKNAKGWQVPLASLLGATPGCGGAIIVVAAYSSGNVGFGAVVAALTATMGDAAFLLIATRPEVAIVVLPLSFGVGILSGYVVDAFSRTPYLGNPSATCALAPLIGCSRKRDYLAFALFVPGLAVGITQLTGADVYEVWGQISTYVGLAGVAVSLVIWTVSQVQAMTHTADSPVTRMAEETAFILVWVIGAYLAYDYVVEFAGLDLEAMFKTVAPLLPLIGVLIGLVPGCGPQVVVTTLYINGLVPFAALMGNAISNDGDALFPAIALNPKAALWATVYSTIPAVIMAYGFYFLAPDFMN